MANLTFLLPGLPGDDGRVSWRRHEVEYVRGRTLAGYLAADLFLKPHQVSHVVIQGKVLDPQTMAEVAAPETKWQRRWRKLLRRPSPTVQVLVFAAYIPTRGAEIAVIPNVAGKNASVILGAVGIVAGIALAAYTGGASLSAMGALQAAIAGYGIGSYIGSLLTPKPRISNSDEGSSSILWQGTKNDDRAGVPKPILVGEMLVGGKRIGMVRRRYGAVPVRSSAGSHDDSAPFVGSETLHLLILIAGHPCWGPVGITSPDVPANTTLNPPDVRINGSHYDNYPNVDVQWRTGAPGQSVIRGFDVVANTYDLSVDLTATHHTTPYLYTTVDEVDAFEVLLNLPGLSHSDDTGGLQKNTTRYRLRYRKVGDPSWSNADYEGQRTLGAATRAERLETRRIEKLPDGSDLPRGQYEIELQWIDDVSTEKNADKDQWHILLSGINEEIQQQRNYEGDSLLAIQGLATEQLSGPVPTISSVWRGYEPRVWNPITGWADGDWGVGDFAPAGKNPFWLAANLLLDSRIGGGHDDEDIDLSSVIIAAGHANLSEHVVPADGSTPYDEPRHQFCNYFDVEQEEQDFVQGIVSTARGCLIYSGNKYRFGVDAVAPEDASGRPIVSQVFGMGSMLTTGEPPDEQPTFNLQFKSERHEVNTFEATFPDAAADWETDSHSESIDNRDPVSVTGDTTSGSPVITGITSTDLIDLGSFVSVSAGFTGMVPVLAKTTHSLTLDADATSSEAGVSVSIGGVFVTEDDLVAADLPVLRRKMQFVGVDRRTQVARELRFALRQTFALREIGSFGASTKAMLSEAYDLIGLANDTPQWSFSGRIMDGCLNNLVMFDRDVDFDEGTPYGVMVHFRDPGPDGKDLIETRTVADVSAPADGSRYFGVMVTEPFSRVPQEGEEWYYGILGQEVRPARIVDIDRDADDERAVSFAEYNASVYDVSGPIVLPHYSLLPDLAAPPGPIPDLKASSIVRLQDDGRRVTDVILQWSRPKATRTEGSYKGARIDYSLDNENWAPLDSVDALEHRWVDAPHGIHIWFRVLPYSISGKYNLNGAAFADIIPEGYGAPSPVVTGISGGYADGANVISWSALGPEYEYEVRTSNPADWSASATGFLWRGKTTRFLHELPAARSIQYFVRARDPFGNYSVAAATVTVNDTAPAAPTITTVTRYKDSIKIKVTPPATTPDIIAIHLHAAQSSGFIPSASNRVATPVGPLGGEFLFRTATAGHWYFKATCEDWLSARIGDWIYTTEDDDNIVVIAPVNPTITMPAGFVVTMNLVKDVEPSGGGYKPVTRFTAVVTWGHTDSVNPAGSVIGFAIVLYDATTGIGTPLDDTVIYDPVVRTFTFPDVSGLGATNGIAAVKALYVDGLTSDFITSTGVVIPQPTNPHIQSVDDRNAFPYCESFWSATPPSGFAYDGCSFSTVTNPKELTLVRTSAGAFRLNFNFVAWASYYRDSAPSGSGIAFVQMMIVTPSQLTGPVVMNGNNGTGTVADVTLPIANDGGMHVYRVPWGYIDATGVGPPNLRLDLTNSGLPIGGVVRISTIGVAFQSFDLELDGTMDYVISAREQYAKDPDGDGLYGISPFRLADANGNYLAVQENGFYFLRDQAGHLVTETPYKLGRNGRFGGYSHGGRVEFGTAGGWGLTIIIPEPTSYDKTRIVIQDVATDLVPTGTVGTSGIRKWIEACNFGTVAGSPSFMLAGAFFYGGTLTTYSATGPWSPTSEAKSSLLLQADSGTTNAASDAWYYVQNDGLPNDTTGFPLDVYFRCVVWVTITLPESKNVSGSFHYVDLQFTCRIGDASMSGSQMNLTGTSYLTHGPYKIRVLANGETVLRSIVMGQPGNAFIGRDHQNVKVDWHSQTWETGGAGTVVCEIYKIDWTYINQCEDIKYLGLADVGFAWLEEFPG